MEDPSKPAADASPQDAGPWTGHQGVTDNDVDAIRYRILVEHGLGLICTHDLEGRILSINKAAAGALGMEPRHIVGRYGRDMLPSSVRHLFDGYLARIRRDGIDEGFMRLAARGGEELIWLYRNVLYRETDGHEYVLGHAQDVTRLHRTQKENQLIRDQLEIRVEQRTHELRDANERLHREMAEHKKTTEALSASENRQRALLEAIPDMIFRMKRDGTILDFKLAPNVAPYVPPEDFVGKTLREILPRDVARQGMTAIRRACDNRKPEIYEYRLPTNGQERDFEARILASGTEEVFAVVRDVTERKEAELARRMVDERQQHLERVESLGALAGGIAHDFNNLLMSILGYAELARSEIQEDHPAVEKITHAITAATRASELTMQMLTFAGSGTSAQTPVNINTLVHEADQRMRELLTEEGRLIYELAEDTPVFVGDASHVRQVLLNLVSNASEALSGEQGLITISTDRTDQLPDSTAPELPVHQPTAVEYVHVRVADTGCGMAADTRSKMFDPFFTTKFTGRGLGLATVLGVVRAHKGALRVESAPGNGTIFDIWFPAVTASASSDMKPAAVAPGAVDGQTVLVVDDDPRVRDVARQMLERTGFTVLAAENGREGLHLFENHPDVVAVLLDLTMPVMDGKEALRLFKRLAPQLPVVLMSGYDEREATDMTDDRDTVAFLQKPFARQSLIEAIGRVLNRVLDQP